MLPYQLIQDSFKNSDTQVSKLLKFNWIGSVRFKFTASRSNGLDLSCLGNSKCLIAEVTHIAKVDNDFNRKYIFIIFEI